MCGPPPGSLRPRPAAGAAAVTLEQREGGGGGTDRRMCVLPFFWGGGCHAQGGPPHPPLPPPSARAGPMAGGGPQPPRPTPESFPAFRFLLNYPHSQVAGGGGGGRSWRRGDPPPPNPAPKCHPQLLRPEFWGDRLGFGGEGGVISTPKPRRVPGTCPGDAGRDEDPGPQSLGSPHPATSPGTHPLFCTPKQRRRACTHPPFLLSAGKKGVTPLEGPLGDGCCRPPPMIPGPFWGKTKIND